jgi:hypothetical protein
MPAATPATPISEYRAKVLKGCSHLCAPNYCRRYRPAARHAQPIGERLAARGTAHQQRMPLFAAQQPIGLALFCQ